VALAQAQAQVIATLGDLRRAQEAGPQLAEYIRARTELQQKWEDMKVRLLQRIVPMLNSGMGILEKLIPLVEAIVASIAMMAGDTDVLKNGVENILKRLREEKGEEAATVQSGLEEVMRQLLGGLNFREGGG